MSTISNEVNNQVVLFHDGSKLFITTEQANKIFQQSGTVVKSILINGNLYTLSSISKIIELSEFYRQYPEQAPEKRKVFDEDDIVEMTEEQVKNMRKGLFIGLKKYIDEEKSKGNNPKFMEDFYANKLSKINHSNQISSL